MTSAKGSLFNESTTRLNNSITSVTVFVGVAIFVCILLLLPYHLTQIGKKNSTELNALLHVDDNYSAQLEDIISLPMDEWQTVNEFNFGLNSSPHWIRVDIPKNDKEVARLLLINYGLLDHLDVWFLATNKNESEIVGAYKTGDAFPFSERMIKSETFLFQVPDEQGHLRVFIRAKSKGPLKIPIEIWTTKDYTEYSSLQKLFMGLFFGYMVAMAISNLFIYASTKNRIFAYYTAYVTFIGLTVASLHGIGFHYLWPNNLWIQEFSPVIFASLTVVFIISLAIDLLALKNKSPTTYKILRNIRYVFFGVLALCAVLPYEVILKGVLLLLIITTPIILISGAVLALKGSSVARYFCGAWAVLLISGVSVSMDNLGLYESAIDSSYLLIVGAITEALLLAMALAVSFNEQMQNAKQTRNDALKNEQEAIDAMDKLMAVQDENRDNLNYSIEERTLELEVALRELAEKNRELEKLSAVDPLTGLMNRRFFDKRMLAESRRSRREMTTLGVAMLDIDYFKKINDTYGHLCGDHCLQVFANILKESVKRPSDIICRYGGEEFVLILPNTDQAGLTKLLEKIRKNVENKKILFEGHTIMTVSIGGCSRIIATEDEHELIIAFADKLLYSAKEAGRNRVTVGSY